MNKMGTQHNQISLESIRFYSASAERQATSTILYSFVYSIYRIKEPKRMIAVDTNKYGSDCARYTSSCLPSTSISNDRKWRIDLYTM